MLPENESVFFRNLNRETIRSYLDCNEWQDKAGAYGIQDRAALFVEKIEGDYLNVVGLSIVLLDELLQKVIPAQSKHH